MKSKSQADYLFFVSGTIDSDQGHVGKTLPISFIDLKFEPRKTQLNEGCKLNIYIETHLSITINLVKYYDVGNGMNINCSIGNQIVYVI